MASTVDLRQLSVDRGPSAPRTAKRKSHLLTRYVLPGSLLCGFAGLVAWSASASLLPSTPVTVAPVIVARAEVRQAGLPLFQAAGWVEPRPTPTVVSALAEGVVQRLLVVEGQSIEAGQPLAELIDQDARLALEQSKALQRLREGELAAASAEATAARVAFEQPLELQAALADAESEFARLQKELTNLPFKVRAAAARLELARQDLEGKRQAGEAVAGRSLQRARNEFDAATAALDELRARQPGLEREAAAIEQKRDALQKQLDLRSEETRRLAEALANVQVSEARLKQAQLSVKTAELQLERMTIRSPISGRVLALHSQPGKRLMGLNAASDRDASAVVSLFEPSKLQVRADVRLEDVRQVQPGQPVQIETAAHTEPITGEVLTATSMADIQKNTLQVKVAIHDPPVTLRPDMLVQVTFLAPEGPETKSEGSEDPLRLLIPRQLVDSSESGAAVWVADRVEGRARRRSITLGQAGTEQLVEVVAGLTATDRLISTGSEQLSEGARIRITGEDRSPGSGQSGQPPAVQVQPPAARVGQKTNP